MKKTLLLFFSVLLLAGCSTEVNLVIDTEKVSETIKIFDLKDKVYFDNVLNEEIKSNIEVFERGYEFYETNEYDEDNYVGKTYHLSENIELWAELSHLRPCYEMFQLTKTDGNISLETSDEYRCGYLFGANNVKLTIESDLELISSNADMMDGNKLIWNINDNNYKHKSIKFNFNTTKAKNDLDDPKYMIIIFFTVACIIAMTVLLVKKQNKENNKI